MATFAFKALDLAGVSHQGRDRGDDKQAVAPQLRSKGLIVVDIEEQEAASAGDILARFKRVKADELTIATRQLSTMVASGMSLLRALYVLEEQTENDKLKEILVEVRKDVEAGISLSDALKRHPDVFNELYVAMVAAGETGGILEETLDRVADQLEKTTPRSRQVRAAMVYPTRDRRVRADRAARAGRPSSCRCSRSLQGLRRRAAGDHQVHRRAVAPRARPLVHADRRHVGVVWPSASWKKLRRAAACSGTASS